MEEGSFRCDANISIRPEGTKKLGTKVELKNMNSLKSIFQALSYEVKRQTNLFSSGKSIIQETRGWSEQKNITVSQRIKEDSEDYRYFPEPDIPPLELTNSLIDKMALTLPELPAKKIDRFMDSYELSEQDAISLTASKDIAVFFENTLLCKLTASPKTRAKMISNYVLVELKKLLNANDTKIQDLKFKPSDASKLFDFIDSKEINNNQGKIVFEKMFLTGHTPNSIIKSLNMSQVSDSNIIEAAINQAIESNQQAVTDYLNGKNAALQFLFGQVMKITKGSASTQVVSELLKNKLGTQHE
jgi:aspartyl-tRNA(Asn)/glutamyl-tRNA(Gln) amidotransferase subunit B